MDGLVMMAHPVADFQQQGDGELSHRSGPVSGDVGHHDAPFLGCRHIHHIVAGSQDPDESQMRAAVDDLFGQGGLIGEYDFRIPDPLEDLFFIGHRSPIVDLQITQRCHSIPADVSRIQGIPIQYDDFLHVPSFFLFNFLFLRHFHKRLIPPDSHPDPGDTGSPWSRRLHASGRGPFPPDIRQQGPLSGPFPRGL